MNITKSDLGSLAICFLGLTLFCFFAPGQANAQSPGAKPVKIAIRPQAHSVGLNQDMAMKCVLLDANNMPAKAPKDLNVEIQYKLPSGKVETVPVLIKAGESSYMLAVPAREAGITEVQAKQKQLLGSTTYIKVKSAKPSSALGTHELDTIDSAARRASLTASRVMEMRTAVRPDSDRVPASEAAGPATNSSAIEEARVAKASPAPTGSGRVAATSTGNPSEAAEEIGLILKHDSRTCLADGKDTANIFAFLDEKVSDAPVDILVTLLSDMGELIPVPLLIQKGQDTAQAKLTSRQVGTVTVEYVRSKPPVVLRSGREMKIRFGPPITGLEARSSPPKISLLETADLVIRLVDASGTSVSTDEPRVIDLAMVNGSGDCESNVIVIAANSASVHARFLPTNRGLVQISASTPSLMPSTFTVLVTFPVMLLGCSLAGGFMGGAIASSISKGRREHKLGWVIRIAIGCVTGFLLYYFGVVGFISHIPRSLAVNPFGALALSIVGGWLGTEVFTPILQWLGLGKVDQRDGAAAQPAADSVSNP